jgi:hypothetical protein
MQKLFHPVMAVGGCPNETELLAVLEYFFRFVLAAEDHLRRKMSKMEERMHSLEDALAIIQSTDSKQPHPLLARPLILDDDTAESEETKISNNNSYAGLTDAFGGLHMDGDHGASRFFGPSGGSEVRSCALYECFLKQVFLICL